MKNWSLIQYKVLEGTSFEAVAGYRGIRAVRMVYNGRVCTVTDLPGNGGKAKKFREAVAGWFKLHNIPAGMAPEAAWAEWSWLTAKTGISVKDYVRKVREME